MESVEINEINFSRVFDSAIEKADLLAFGETYHGSHKLVLKRLMDQLGRFSVFFWEKPVNFQPEVDDYFRTGKLGLYIESSIVGAAREGKDIREDVMLILDTGQKCHVPILCVDSSKIQTEEYCHKSNTGYYFTKGESRDEDMFNNVVNAINRRKGRWCFWGGWQHLEYGKHFRTGYDTLGTRLRDKYGERFLALRIK